MIISRNYAKRLIREKLATENGATFDSGQWWRIVAKKKAATKKKAAKKTARKKR